MSANTHYLLKPSNISQKDHNSHLIITKGIVGITEIHESHGNFYLTVDAFGPQIYHFHCFSYQINNSVNKHFMVTVISS